MTTPAFIHEPVVCSTGTPTFGNDTSEIVEDNACMLMDCASIPSDLASPSIELPLDGLQKLQRAGKKRSNTSRVKQQTVVLCCRRARTTDPPIRSQGKCDSQSKFVCLYRVCTKPKRGYGTHSRQGTLSPSNRRFSPGSKRKGLTYNGKDDVRPFARHRFLASQAAIASNALGSVSTTSVVSVLSRTQKDQPPSTTYASVVVSPSESTLLSF